MAEAFLQTCIVLISVIIGYAMGLAGRKDDT